MYKTESLVLYFPWLAFLNFIFNFILSCFFLYLKVYANEAECKQWCHKRFAHTVWQTLIPCACICLKWWGSGTTCLLPTLDDDLLPGESAKKFKLFQIQTWELYNNYIPTSSINLHIQIVAMQHTLTHLPLKGNNKLTIAFFGDT